MDWTATELKKCVAKGSHEQLEILSFCKNAEHSSIS